MLLKKRSRVHEIYLQKGSASGGSRASDIFFSGCGGDKNVSKGSKETLTVGITNLLIVWNRRITISVGRLCGMRLGNVLFILIIK